MCMSIYIYIERERERERESDTYVWRETLPRDVKLVSEYNDEI